MLSIVYSASSNTLLQLEAREEYRGRVLALYMLLFAGSTPIGSAVTGLISDRWDIRVALGVNAGLCILGVLLAGLYVAVAQRAPAQRLRGTEGSGQDARLRASGRATRAEAPGRRVPPPRPSGAARPFLPGDEAITTSTQQ